MLMALNHLVSTNITSECPSHIHIHTYIHVSVCVWQREWVQFILHLTVIRVATINILQNFNWNIL